MYVWTDVKQTQTHENEQVSILLRLHLRFASRIYPCEHSWSKRKRKQISILSKTNQSEGISSHG